MSQRCLGIFSKPIVCVSVDGFYDEVERLLKRAEKDKPKLTVDTTKKSKKKNKSGKGLPVLDDAEVKHAIKIQSHFRGFAFRNELHKEFEQEMEASAKMIQALFRGFVVREELRSMEVR